MQGDSGLPVGLILVLGMAGFVSAADNWVVSALLPAVAADFGTGIATAAGVLTAYLVPYGVMQPVYGHLADRFGKASVLRCILAGLTLATVGCVLAPALGWLMVCRFVAGFFAAGIIAVSLAMIGDETAPSRRPQGVGMFMGMVFLGQGFSAGIGGFLADWLDWRMMFVCLIGVALDPVVLPEIAVRKKETGRKAVLAGSGRHDVLGTGTLRFSDGVRDGISLARSVQLSGKLSARSGTCLISRRGAGRHGVRDRVTGCRLDAWMAFVTCAAAWPVDGGSRTGWRGSGTSGMLSVDMDRCVGRVADGNRLYFPAIHTGDAGFLCRRRQQGIAIRSCWTGIVQRRRCRNGRGWLVSDARRVWPVMEHSCRHAVCAGAVCRDVPRRQAGRSRSTGIGTDRQKDGR